MALRLYADILSPFADKWPDVSGSKKTRSHLLTQAEKAVQEEAVGQGQLPPNNLRSVCNLWAAL